MELKENQAALVLEESEDGEISVNVAASDMDSLAGSFCRAIAHKLMYDEAFQAELMEMLSEDEEEE